MFNSNFAYHLYNNIHCTGYKLLYNNDEVCFQMQEKTTESADEQFFLITNVVFFVPKKYSYMYAIVCHGMLP